MRKFGSSFSRSATAARSRRGVTVSQATSHVSTDAAEAEDGGAAKGRNWWLTLPGILTGLAGLISATTGLVVAIHQLWPSSHAAPTSQAAALVTTQSAANTLPSTVGAGKQNTASNDARRAVRVSLSEGRHAQVGEATYDVLSATARPGNPGELGLVLRVRMTNGGRYPGNFWSSSFRLRVGTDISTPTNMLDDVVAAGTTDTGEVDFTLPASARQATLLVGDDAGKAVALPLSLNGGRS